MPLAMFLNDTPFELEERQSNERGRAIEVTVGSLPELQKTSSLVLGEKLITSPVALWRNLSKWGGNILKMQMHLEG